MHFEKEGFFVNKKNLLLVHKLQMICYFCLLGFIL